MYKLTLETLRAILHNEKLMAMVFCTAIVGMAYHYAPSNAQQIALPVITGIFSFITGYNLHKLTGTKGGKPIQSNDQEVIEK